MKTYLIVSGLLVLVIVAKLASISLWDFFFQIGLTAVGVVLALAYADLGKPRLRLEIIAHEKVLVGTEETLFLKLRVFNGPRKDMPFVSRGTAFSCHGSISFADMSNKIIFEMSIRWSNNPQPIRYDLDQGKISTLVDQSLIRASRFIDISADESEELDVCFRNPNEIIAYGWNSDSYMYKRSRHPERNIPSGDYLIRVKIKHNDGSVQSEFLLHNPQEISQFKLVSNSNK